MNFLCRPNQFSEQKNWVYSRNTCLNGVIYLVFCQQGLSIKYLVDFCVHTMYVIWMIPQKILDSGHSGLNTAFESYIVVQFSL